MARKVAECVRCARTRPIVGHGLCNPCYVSNYRRNGSARKKSVDFTGRCPIPRPEPPPPPPEPVPIPVVEDPQAEVEVVVGSGMRVRVSARAAAAILGRRRG